MPIEKIFPKTLRDKFLWAMSIYIYLFYQVLSLNGNFEFSKLNIIIYEFMIKFSELIFKIDISNIFIYINYNIYIYEINKFIIKINLL